MVEISIRNFLSTEDILRVADGELVSLDNDTESELSRRRIQIVEHIEKSQEPAYGFNRGFGHNVDRAVSGELLSALQINLIRSHCCGVGEALPRNVVRAAMLLRAQSLARGHSGIRPAVINQLIAFLNNNIIPVVPRYGSVGASGDLAPLSHIALGLVGEGRVMTADGSALECDLALRRAGIKPLTLEMKEGLALTNGVQVSTAMGIVAYGEILKLLKHAALATAMSAQVMLASDSSYSAELHALRPHPGAVFVASWIRNLMTNSPIREVHRPFWVDGELQDPYNIRCAGQILGTCYDLLAEAKATFEVEANSATDNPLLLENPENPNSFTSIVSGGHFHGMPIAVKIFNLLQALGIMARLSNMRCARFVDQARNKGLGSDLIWPNLSEHEKSISSGMMIPEYVSASLTNTIWGACMPSHLFSLSTDAGQEDHVSMSAGLAVRVLDTIPRLAEVLAIELSFAAQAAAVRKASPAIPSKVVLTTEHRAHVVAQHTALLEAIKQNLDTTRFEPEISVTLNYRWQEKDRKLSPICENVLKRIGEIFPTITGDRELSEPLKRMAQFVMSGDLLKIAAPAFG